MKKAAENLERFDKQFSQQQRTHLEQVSVITTLSALTLEELAEEGFNGIFAKACSTG